VYERFTDRARKVMHLANQEAHRLNHEYIGTEHILLGLVKDGAGAAADVLKNLDIDLRKIRLEVEKVVRPGPDRVTMGKLPQTPRAKKVIEYSIEEARNLNHNYVGTEHLLLGLLREQEGVAARVLTRMLLGSDPVRLEVLKLLGHNDAPALARAGVERLRAERAWREVIRARAVPLPRLFALARFWIGGLLGAAAGSILAGLPGVLLGQLTGILLALWGRTFPAALAGAIAGALIGSVPWGDDAWAVAGAVIGGLLGSIPSYLFASTPPPGRIK
jgi:hypothetical protein